jgi:hypothetical protein
MREKIYPQFPFASAFAIFSGSFIYQPFMSPLDSIDEEINDELAASGMHVSDGEDSDEEEDAVAPGIEEDDEDAVVVPLVEEEDAVAEEPKDGLEELEKMAAELEEDPVEMDLED